MATEEVEDPEQDITISLIEESKEELERWVKLWPIVVLAREAQLVDNMFVDNLMKQGLSAESNPAIFSVFFDKIKKEESWFDRFLNILSIWPAYRPLAEQLSRKYYDKLAEKRGVHPSFQLLKILHKAIETLTNCKTDLQKALKFYGLVSVQHCVEVLGLAVDHLQLEVRSTEAQTRKADDKPSLVERLKVLPSKADHVQSTHPPRATRDQSSSQSPVVSSQRHKSSVKDDNVTAQHPERSQWGYSDVQVVHEVLRRNRGFLEHTIPIDAIIPQLHAQDLLLDYEYAELTSQPFPIKRNRSLIDAFLRKVPSTFYQFCSILEGQHGYEYIAHYLLREVRDLDPNIPLEDKMKNFGITWSPGLKGTDPSSKNIPQRVDALVDRDMMEKSIQSIFDKQIEMAEDTKRIHQMEVSQLKKTVSGAKDTVDIVKAECIGLVQQMEQGKLDSSGHVSALMEKIQEIVQVCEDVQTQKLANLDSSVEALVNIVNLERRIGQLTTSLEEKERELQIWKGTAERREEMLSASQERYQSLVAEHEELRLEYARNVAKYEEMKENSGKEIKKLASELLQEKGIDGEHLVRKEGEGNLKLSAWQDGTCYHLQIHQKKDEASRASYSLDEKVYFDGIEELCNNYKREPLPGYSFKLHQ